MTKKLNYMLKGIPPEFWHQVKIYCITNKITIKQLIIDLLKKHLDEEE